MASSAYCALKGQTEKNESEIITNMDPLGADDVMKWVPELNNRKDLNALILLADKVMPTEPDLRGFNFHQANAAIRDIGIFLGSIKRHGVEPQTVIRDLEATMNILAAKTSMPPRDTLLHYTIWNPGDHRRRTYTGTADENYLIDSVVMAIDPLMNAIRLLKELQDTPMRSAEFRYVCKRITGHFQKVVDGIVLARRKVSMAYFATELRLYFDPILLGEQAYLGPGAVEMPMFVFDHLLWSCDDSDETYRIFKETYLPYVHPEMREVYFEFQNQESLLSKCLKTVANRRDDFDPDIYESMRALRQCFQQLKSFRMPHKKVAEEAYAHEEKEGIAADPAVANYRTNGSGGYSPGVLSQIVKLTNEQIARLDSCVSIYAMQSGKSLAYVEINE